MSQTFTASNSGLALNTIQDNLLANTNTLRSSFSGASSPSGPVVGQLFLHEGGAASGDDVLKVYADLDGGGDAFVEAGRYLHENPEFVGASANHSGQLVNYGFESNAGTITAGSNNVGRFYLNTLIGKAQFIATSSKRETILSGNNSDYIPRDLPLNLWTKGATPPTDATIGSSPATPAWLLDAVGESAVIKVKVPAGYSADADVKLRLAFALNVSETANDDLDITADVRVVEPNSNEALDGTSTQYTGTVDIGSNTAQYSVHEVEIDLTYNDATNPIAAGDWIAIEFHLTNVTGVAAALFLGAQALFPLGSKITE